MGKSKNGTFTKKVPISKITAPQILKIADENIKKYIITLFTPKLTEAQRK